MRGNDGPAVQQGGHDGDVTSIGSTVKGAPIVTTLLKVNTEREKPRNDSDMSFVRGQMQRGLVILVHRVD
jgi:hypothetical protein